MSVRPRALVQRRPKCGGLRRANRCHTSCVPIVYEHILRTTNGGLNFMAADQTRLDWVKRLLKAHLQPSQIAQIRRLHWRSQHAWLALRHGRDLRAIGETFGAGKHASFYALYERHLASRRRSKFNLLEIGVGGYETPAAGGGSLRMWAAYFPRANVFGIDIHDKSLHDGARVRTFRGSQADESFLRQVARDIRRLDVVIDDGSHMNDHVLTSFRTLFPLLAQNGVYVIEDTQTSYWEAFGGSSTELSRPDTTIGFVKGLLDGLNYQELPSPSRRASELDDKIVGVHCYHNIVFIEKGCNSNASAV